MVKYRFKEGTFPIDNIELPEGSLVLERSGGREIRGDEKVYLWWLEPKKEGE